MSGCPHPAGEELLALALDPAACDPELARAVDGCASCAARRDELGAFAGVCRESLDAAVEAAVPDRRARALAERVLSALPREDLRLRGDLALVGRFVAARLRASGLLRLAAAGLLAHLLVLPVLALIVLRGGRPDGAFQVSLEPGALPLPTDVREPRREVEEIDLAGEEYAVRPMEDGPRDLLAVENRLRADRLALRRTSAPPPGGDEGLLDRLLDARARQVATRELEPFAAAGRGLQRATALEGVLWAELLLDRYAMTGELAPCLPAALARLGAAPGQGPGLRRLQAAALERAEGYGLLDQLAPPSAGWRAAELVGVAGTARRTPLDASWLRELAPELLQVGTPAARAWARWAER